MSQIIFIASSESIATLEDDENPAQAYPCMSSQQFHREARAQLYTLVTGEFLHEASQMETLHRAFDDDGPYIYQLKPRLRQALARVEEDHIEPICLTWMQCEDIEVMDLESSDLHDFMFQLVHFCQTAGSDDLGVYIYSDD